MLKKCLLSLTAGIRNQTIPNKIMTYRAFLSAMLFLGIAFISSNLALAVSDQVDSSFAIGSGAGFPTEPNPVNWGQVQAVAVQADGKVIAGGQALFDDFNGTPVPAFCRINVDGSLDTAFQANVGTGPLDSGSPEVNSIVIQPDGKILIGGPFNSYNGTARGGIARLNADGSLDTSFQSSGSGVNGIVRYVNRIVLQPDGKILIAGGFTSYAGVARAGVARLNSDGTLDTTFNPGSTGLIGLNCVAVQPDGKIYVSGSFTNWLGLAAPGIVRLQSNGALDTSFIPTHKYPFPSVGAIAPLGDGRVLIGGFVQGTETSVIRYLARLNADGSLDASYPAGSVSGWVSDIVPWPAGGHLIMGRFNSVGGQPRGELALLDDNGQVDPTFAPPPVSNPAQDNVHVYTAAVAPDGKIVIGGWFINYPNNTQLNGQDYSGIARLIGGFTGGPGTIRFTSASQLVDENAGSITISVSRLGGSVGAVSVNYTTVAGSATAGADYTTKSGTLSWAAGEFGNKTITIPIIPDSAAEGMENFTVQLSGATGGASIGTSSLTVSIIDDDSVPTILTQPQDTSALMTFDASFRVGVGPGPLAAYQWLSNSVPIANATNALLNLVNVQTNFATGYSVIVSNVNGAITSSVANLTVIIPAGLPEPSFVIPGTGFNSDVYKIAFGDDGSIIAVGLFSQYGGTSIPNYIAKINADGSRDTGFPAAASGANGAIQTVATYPDGHLLIAGNFSQYNGTSRSRVARLNADGSLDVTFNGSASAPSIYAVLPQADGSAFIGDSSFVRKFTSTGANDTNWTQAVLPGQVYALAQQADGKILAAPYRTSGGIYGSEIVRLNPDGTRDLSFVGIGRFNSQIQTIKLLPDGRILVGGGFTSLISDDATNSVPYIAVLHADGTLDPAFNTGTGPNGSIIESFVQPDGRILVGGAFTTWNGAAVKQYARILPNGQIDPTFVIDSGANSYVRAIAMDAAGRIAIGGSFTQVNGRASGRLAMLTYDGGAIQLTTGARQVNEQDGSVTVSVERVAGSRGAVSVNYATAFGSAGSSDFTAANSILSWADGEYGVKNFNITLNNDSTEEADESFDVALSAFTGAVPGLFTNQTIQILDDESKPRIATHPVDVVAAEETAATFTAAAFSALPITYQWRSNSVDLLNATNPSLTLINVQSNYAAAYSVRVSNSNGFTDSSNAVLTVIPSPTRRDVTFNVSPAFNGAVRAVVPLGDGRVMVGGDFTQPRNKIVLLNVDGSIDGTFTNTATAIGGFTSVYDIERDSKGRWLVAGSFGSFGGVSSANITRLNPDFSVDTNFLTALSVPPNNQVRDVTVGPDGKIWIAGDFNSVGGPFGRQYVARLNENGSLDSSFLGHANGPVYRVLPLPDGSALLAGSFSSYDGFGGYLRKCLADGSVDRAYSPSVNGQVYDAIALADGSVVAAGNFNSPASRMIKIKANGSVDSSFLEGVTSSGAVNSLGLQSNGRIVAGGAFTSMGIHPNRFTRINADGTQDTSLSLGTGFNSEVYRVALEHTGQIWVGGAFTSYKGVTPGYLVRLAGDQPAVAIGQQPVDMVVAVGAGATLSATAAGTGALTYQWMKDGVALSNGGAVSGANTDRLSLAGVAIADEGHYSMVVSNSAGAFAISRAAFVQVKSAPAILSDPVGGFVPAGGRIALSVEAEGAPVLAFQWLKDGVPVGGNSPLYVLTNAPATASGNYQVIVSNGFNSATSAVAAVTVQATPATLAPGFFSDAGVAGINDTIYALQPLPDGTLLVGGSFGSIKTNGASTVARQNLALFNTNGTAAAFNPAASTQVNDVVRQRDGKILVAGHFTGIGGENNRRYLARFNADLTFDTNFHHALYRNFSTNGPDSAVSDIALQADGKILIVGGFNSVLGKPNTRGIARLNPDGSLDESFASRATSAFGSACVEVLPDGRILYAGSGTYNGHSASIYRLFPDGSVDTSFTNSLGAAVTALAVQTNGAIVVGGNFTTPNGANRPLLARLLGNGQLDMNFLAGVTNFSGYNQAVIRTVAIQENGKILAGGNFLTFGPFRNGLARINADGTPDSTFVFQQGLGDDYNADIWKISLFADGRIVIGGHFTPWEGTPENGLAVLNGDPVELGFAAQPVDQFVLSGTDVQFSARAIGASAISYQWFRGDTALTDGGAVSGATTPTLSITGVSTADAELYSLQISNASGTRRSLTAELYILGAPEFREQPFGGTYYVSNSLSLHAVVLGVTPMTYQWFFNSNMIPGATNDYLSFASLALTHSGDYQLVANNTLGAVTSVVATVSVLMPPASLSERWLHPAGANGSIYAIQPLGDGRVIIGGQFTAAGPSGYDTARANLALLNANGTVDTSFNPAPDGQVQVVRRDGNGRFLVGGWFNSIGGQARSYLARLNSDGSLDTGFLTNLGTGPDRSVNDIAIQSDGKILVGGSFNNVSGSSYPGVVRLNADGSIDGSFRLNTSNPQVQSLSLRADGKIYIGGFLNVSNRQNLARLEPNGAIDLTFSGNANSQVSRVLATSDGGVLLGGFFSTVNGNPAPNFARLAVDGSLDTAWPQNRPDGSVENMIFQPNGKLVIVGQFFTVGASRLRIARLNTDGALDTAFAPGNGLSGNAYSIALESDGSIWVGGNFTFYNNKSVNRLVLLAGDPATPGTGSPFENWAESTGLTSGNSAPDDDPDHDGVPNIFEYYFGRSPLHADSASATSGISVNAGGQNYPAITFVRVKNAGGVSLIPRASSNVNFSDSLGTTVESVVDLGDGTERVTIRSNASTASQTAQFLRIQLSVP